MITVREDPVLTDGVHLVCVDEKRLHAFAGRMGLRREWYQLKPLSIPHYDLTTPSALRRALQAGAIRVHRLPFRKLRLAYGLPLLRVEGRG